VPFRADPLLEQAEHRAQHVFENDLQRAGLFHAEARSDEQAERRHHQNDQHHHYQEWRDRLVRRREMMAHRLAGLEHQRPQHGVDDGHDPERVF